MISAILVLSALASLAVAAPAALPTCDAVLAPSISSVGICSCLQSCKTTESCCAGYDDFQSSLTNFLVNNGLINPSSLVSSDTAVSQYEVTSTTTVGASSMLVAKLCSYKQSVPAPGDGSPKVQPVPELRLVGCVDDGFQVVAYTGNSQFQLFEDVVLTAQSLTAAFGASAADATGQTSSLYYAQLTGSGAVNAYKAIAAGVDVCGFSATLPVQPTGKADFDPTPDRTWAVSTADFVNYNHRSLEITNVTPDQLDQDYDRYAQNAQYTVNPWTACHLRSVNVNSAWVAVDSNTLSALVQQ
ncbi:hypothetical protein RI367_001447 [Sorochytrium milnesiophthora]